jgi:hypothetical protein
MYVTACPVIFFARINRGKIGTKKHSYILISGWNKEKRGNFLFAVELIKVKKFYIALHRTINFVQEGVLLHALS